MVPVNNSIDPPPVYVPPELSNGVLPRNTESIEVNLMFDEEDEEIPPLTDVDTAHVDGPTSPFSNETISEVYDSVSNDEYEFIPSANDYDFRALETSSWRALETSKWLALETS